MKPDFITGNYYLFSDSNGEDFYSQTLFNKVRFRIRFFRIVRLSAVRLSVSNQNTNRPLVRPSLTEQFLNRSLESNCNISAIASSPIEGPHSHV
jgi:hypothetical protein